jgi:hypothetical protein
MCNGCCKESVTQIETLHAIARAEPLCCTWDWAFPANLGGCKTSDVSFVLSLTLSCVGVHSRTAAVPVSVLRSDMTGEQSSRVEPPSRRDLARFGPRQAHTRPSRMGEQWVPRLSANSPSSTGTNARSRQVDMVGMAVRPFDNKRLCEGVGRMQGSPALVG